MTNHQYIQIRGIPEFQNVEVPDRPEYHDLNILEFLGSTYIECGVSENVKISGGYQKVGNVFQSIYHVFQTGNRSEIDDPNIGF